MTASPIRQMEAPVMSRRSGRALSTVQSQRSDEAVGDSLFGPTIIATIIVAVPIALLIALALLRIYRRAVIRSMQQRVAPRAAPGSIGALENTPARSDEPPPHPLEIGPHDPPGDGIRLAVKEAIWR